MSTRTEEQEKTVERIREEIASGVYHTERGRIARANEYINGYPDWQVKSRDYARIVSLLGAYAEAGDRQADAACQILHRISPWLAERQMKRVIAEEIGRLANEDWDDVRFRTGPESVRHSDAQRPPTREVRLGLAVLWLEMWPRYERDGLGSIAKADLGWALADVLVTEDHVPGVHGLRWAPLVEKAIEEAKEYRVAA